MMKDGEHRDVIRRLFTIASLRLEAMASAADAGQASSLTAEQATGYANDLITGAQEITALGEAIALLAERF